MKNNKRTLLLVCLGIVVIVLVFLTALEVNAQNQTVEDLARRLEQQGVTVKRVTVLNRIPFEIEIAIQSASSGKDATSNDLWFAQLARREASLAHRLGLPIESYQLTWLNSKGEVISWEKNKLLPDEPSQRESSPPSKLSNETTAKLLKEQLTLGGMTLDKLEVSSDTTLGNNGQKLVVQLSVPDMEKANQSLLPFLASLRPLLDNMNTKQGTRLVICWVRLLDRQGNLLLNYVWDVETREETSAAAPGLSTWYPQPRTPRTPYPGP
jgi:hypothetical protein